MRRLVLLITIIATMLSVVAGPATGAPPTAEGRDGYGIRIVGNARFAPYGGQIDGTTVALRVRVRCPVEAGVTYVPFAGMPDAFDGRFAEPYLPGNTGPATYGGMVTCTGSWVTATTLARSVARNQDPSTDPFAYFRRGRTRFVVQIGEGGDSPARHARTMAVIVPGRAGR